MTDPSTTQLLALSALHKTLVLRDFHLEVTDGPEKGKRFGPFVPPVRVGSAPGNDLVLNDPTVSRFHCTIDMGPEGLTVFDVGSRNGTFLGDYRVLEAYLREAASIRIGQSTLVLQVTGPPRMIEYSNESTFGGLNGDSPMMRALFATLERLARAELPVLIEGETGTGKELVARALHQHSPRTQKPLVVVDCGAVAPTLIESELFGHVKGAFTGADNPRAGAFELADGGTIFLDEIGELALQLQPKLLRVLETGTIKRLGSAEELTVSVRVIAATHRDLRQMVNEGRFREDLYYRLAVCPVHIPPLRERLEDIPLLTRHFLRKALEALLGPHTAETVEPSPDTLALLREKPLTGNVRELRNTVERAVILGDPAAVSRGDLTGALWSLNASDRRAERAPVAIEEAKRRFEREYLIRLLAKYQDDLKAAAQEADVHPKSLERLIRKHGLRKG